MKTEIAGASGQSDFVPLRSLIGKVQNSPATTTDSRAPKSTWPLLRLSRKVLRGIPYASKEIRSLISDHSPFFIARPRAVHIWRGAPCNAKCIMCEYGFLKGEDYRKRIHSVFTDDLMPRTLREIAQLCGRGTVVTYIAGEPTMSKALLDWVRQASALGLDFRFTTNGYLIDEAYAHRLATAGVFNVGVSLESIDPKINEVIRPYPNGTAITMQAIEHLIKARERLKTRFSINVKTVLTHLNLESFGEIVRYYGKRDGMMYTPQIYEPLEGTPAETVDLLYVKDLNRLEGVAADIRILKASGYNIHVTEQGLRELVKLYREGQKARFTSIDKPMLMEDSEPVCNIGTDTLFIQNGEVKLCPWHPPIGRVPGGALTLEQIWKAEITRQVRQATRDCRRLCNMSCLRRTPLVDKIKTFLAIA